VILIEVLFGHGFRGGHYHTLDKLLDTYYLTLMLVVALRWKSPWARGPAVALYVYRFVGVLLFEMWSYFDLDRPRLILFIFPNLYENWWLYCVIVERFWPRVYPHSVKTVAIPMVLLLIPKMAQEYLLHFAEAKPWEFMKQRLGIDP
jgi:hypothetical protein